MKLQNTLKKFLILAMLIILTGSSVWAFSFRNMCLNIIQISDTHISQREDNSYKMLSSSKVLLKDAINTANQIKDVDFVMFTGDMVDTPTPENYKDFFTLLSELNHPSLVAFGNHDSANCNPSTGECTQGLVISDALDFIKRCNRNYIFDTTYYAFTPKTDYHIIVLDPVIRDEITSNGYLDDEQLAFLDYQLQNNQDKVIVIFQHHPVVEPFKSDDHKIRNADKYLAILAKYKNPILICSGHYHSTKITREKNIIHLSTPSLVTFPNAFRYIKITNYNDRTQFQFQFYETNLKDIQSVAKANTIAAATFAGVQKDRVQDIMIRKSYVKTKKPKKEKRVKKKQKEVDVQEEVLEDNNADISDVQDVDASEIQDELNTQEEQIQNEQQI